MITLESANGKYRIYRDGCAIGAAELYDNPYHRGNSYVKLELTAWNNEISAQLFGKLRKIATRPLQIMTDSDDAVMVDFLTAGGFRCRRKCWEVEACSADYMGGKSDAELIFLSEGEPDYERCRMMMFDYYVQTHKAVNPWTAGLECFCDELPADAVCAKTNEEITSLAFLEENEIAYVCGTDEQSFPAFAHSLVTYLLRSYETIFFECDDCDWAAMQLKARFANQSEESYDTYILE